MREWIVSMGGTAAAQSGCLRQDEVFLRGAFHRNLLPCVLSILSENINILVDGVLVGQRIGTDGLTAISLCVPVYLALCVAGSFLVSGTAIQASKAIGRRQREKCQRLYHTAVWACLAVSLPMTAAGLALGGPISYLLCPDPAVRPLVREYASITLLGALPKILIYVPFWFLRIDGRTKLVARMMLVMGLGNAALDLIFLYPLNRGIGGAAWASVIATAAACALGMFWLCGRHSGFHLGRAGITAWSDWREIAGAGSPSALNNLLQTMRVLTVNALLMGAGGSELVAVFTAVNCVSAFSLAVVDGVPQAASAMLGICSGERDNGSAALLLRRELRTGLLCCGAFAAVVVLGSGAIAFAYGLPAGSLDFAMVCLASGMFPALGCSILSGYYNVSGHVGWANAIILCRVFLAAAGSLCAVLALGLSPWWFLIFSELATLALWYPAVSLCHRRHPERTRYLLMDPSLEERGQVLNFSVTGDTAQICQASGRIADFCRDNRMKSRQVLRFSLALEEIMTQIVQENPGTPVRFDVRAFAVGKELGIRFRYDGRACNPFDRQEEPGEAYLGIRLIAGMAEQVVYQRTFGVNTLQLLL